MFGRLTVSSITVAEVVEGLVGDSRIDGLRRFLDDMENIEVLPVGVEEAILAGQIRGELTRTGQGIGELDPFIAAVAIVNGLPLVTGNLRHYERIQSLGFPLQLESWRDALP